MNKKKIICWVCLAVLLCLGAFVCLNIFCETVPVKGEIDSIAGDVVGKRFSNILVVKLDESDARRWGEKVYVITDKAGEFCVKDSITVLFSEVKRPYLPVGPVRIIADEVYPAAVADKPILYFYPERPMVCSAKVTLDGMLTCTYPAHGADGWKNFTANPDGTLVFPDGKEYYALYWEGEQNAQWDFSQGYCVPGADTAAFLEWALAQQGLTAREANEFIIYWLPRMQENPYNVISFQTTAYTDSAALEITPAPDSLIRVFMAYYPTDTQVDIQPQSFESIAREGFTVVEWGGSQVKKP
jgi:hypothetical protein